MYNYYKRYLAILFVTIFACQSFAANDANQLFWTATKGTKKVFILGSIHVANPDFYPLNPAIYKQLESSEALIVEVNDLESKETANYLNQIAQLPKGQKITDGLPPADINRAIKLGDSLGVPFSAFQYKKIWYYSMVMASVQSIKMGYQPQWGIDIHFIKQARQQKLKTIGLETSKEQLEMIDSIQVDTSQFHLILDEIETAPSMIGQLISAWRQGDLNSIDLLMKKSFESNIEMEQILITNRNLNWIKRLNSLLNDFDRLFVVVGAGHLPGEQGLLNLLQLQGFNMETSQ